MTTDDEIVEICLNKPWFTNQVTQTQSFVRENQIEEFRIHTIGVRLPKFHMTIARLERRGYGFVDTHIHQQWPDHPYDGFIHNTRTELKWNIDGRDFVFHVML